MGFRLGIGVFMYVEQMWAQARSWVVPFMCAVGGTWSRRSHVHAGSQVSGSLESAVRDLDEINEEMGRGSGSQAVRVERAGAPAAENGWQRAFRKVEQTRLVDQNGRRPGGCVARHKHCV